MYVEVLPATLAHLQDYDISVVLCKEHVKVGQQHTCTCLLQVGMARWP